MRVIMRLAVCAAAIIGVSGLATTAQAQGCCQFFQAKDGKMNCAVATEQACTNPPYQGKWFGNTKQNTYRCQAQSGDASGAKACVAGAR